MDGASLIQAAIRLKRNTAGSGFGSGDVSDTETTVVTAKMVIQFRRDTTENWIANKNTIPAEGEPCFDIDAKTLKIGDGKTTYENLPNIGVDDTESPQTSVQEIIFVGTELPSQGQQGKLYVNVKDREILIWHEETNQYAIVSNCLEEVSRQDIEDLFGENNY